MKMIMSAICALLFASAAAYQSPPLDFAALSARRFKATPRLAGVFAATNTMRRFDFSHSNGGFWRLQFNYVLNHSSGDRVHGARARVAFGPQTMPWGTDVRGFSIADSGVNSGDLYPWQIDMKVFPGMKFANVSFDLFGQGTFLVSGVELTELPQDPGPVTMLLPFGDYFDGEFHIGAGQVGTIMFAWRTSMPDDVRSGRFRYRIAMPAGFSFVDASNLPPSAKPSAPADDGSVSYAASSPPLYARSGGAMFAVVVRADGKEGTTGTMTVTPELDGNPASDPVSLELVTVDSVKAKRVPTRYANGAYLGEVCSSFKGEGSRALARTLCDAGATWLIPDAAAVTNNRSLLQMWRDEGIRRITPDGSRFVSNGFSLGKYTLCPCLFYDEKSPVRARLGKYFKRLLKGCDGMWSNWEPYGHTGRRQLCQKCAAAEKGLSATARDRRRSAEHGRVVSTLAGIIGEATDPAVGFIPGIYWPELGPGHEKFDFTREIAAGDYARSLSFINAFGPYVRWNTACRYVSEPGRSLAYFCVAREVKRQVDKDFPAGARPSLMAFPLGLSGTDWASRPEWLELALDSFFFNGWGCATPWSFPAGGDARFLAAFARATSLAAEWEDYVWNGVRCDGAVRVNTRGNVQKRPWIDRTYLGSLRNVPLVQYVAWEKGGERIVALFNFDDSEFAVCDVSSSSRSETIDLPPVSCRVVFFPGKRP